MLDSILIASLLTDASTVYNTCMARVCRPFIRSRVRSAASCFRLSLSCAPQNTTKHRGTISSDVETKLDAMDTAFAIIWLPVYCFVGSRTLGIPFTVSSIDSYVGMHDRNCIITPIMLLLSNDGSQRDGILMDPCSCQTSFAGTLKR